MADTECIFCKIVRGEVPCIKLFENDEVLAFMDIFPIAVGHCLVIPKKHYEKLHEVEPEVMASLGPVLVKVAKAVGAEDYNILQNNGKAAHQAVPHVHFHIIPKLDRKTGLKVGWPAKKGDKEALAKLAEEIKGRL